MLKINRTDTGDAAFEEFWKKSVEGGALVGAKSIIVAKIKLDRYEVWKAAIESTKALKLKKS